MIIIKYKNGKVETVASTTYTAWFAAKLEKNGGVEECYDVVLGDDFIENHFEELKPILKEYKIEQEK